MKEKNSQTLQSAINVFSSLSLLQRRVLVCGIYLAAICATNAYYMADTIWYAQSIAAGEIYLWEPLHLFWRPFGWLLWRLVDSPLNLTIGTDVQGGIVLVLIWINLIFGIVAVLAMHDVLEHVMDSSILVDFVTVVFVFSQSFLNFVQSGSSYSTSLACLLLGLAVLVRGSGQKSFQFFYNVGAAAIFAIAVCMWFPFILVIPAAVLFPVFLFGWNQRTIKQTIQVAVMGFAFLSLAYISVAVYLQIYSIGDLLSWFGGTYASYGQIFSGMAPMIMGLPRSFLNMGEDGLIYKRFLANDPYNPVSILGLIRPSLVGIFLFYLISFYAAANIIWVRKGRSILALTLVAGLPVIALGSYWHGGDLERYLSFLPFFFLFVTYSLENWHFSPKVKNIIIIYFTVQIIVNIYNMSTITLNRFQETQAVRVNDLLPLLKPHSLVFTMNQQDELYQVNHNFPLNPTFRPYGEFTDSTIGLEWPGYFAFKTLSIWQVGGDVWVSKRLLSPRPARDWYWVEGSSQGIAWQEIYSYYSDLQWGQSIGGEDGFLLLLPSQPNINILNSERLQK